MGWMKRIAAVLLGLSLAACGGGGGSAGAPPFGGGGNGPGTDPVAADLSLALSTSNISNSGTGVVNVVVTAVDSNRVALAGIPVQLSVDGNAVLIAGGAVTNASGQVTATVGIGADKSNRVVTVTAESGSLERTASFQVTGSKLVATALPAVLAPGAAGQVQYRLTDVNSNPIAGAAVSVSANGVAPAEGVTGANGEYIFAYSAPAQAGTLTINATSAGVLLATDVIVQSGTGSIPNVPVGSVLSASVSANPSVVAVNTETTNNRSEIRALFLGAANAPIRNVRVRFDLNNDPNSIGGQIASGSTVVYSDVNGVATTSYIPGSRSSPTDGVSVRACWGHSDAELASGACPRSTMATLTVISEALAVTIGTNDKIEQGPDGLTYIQRFVVMVVDSSGQAKADVQISPSIDLPVYYKGNYELPDVTVPAPPGDIDGWNRRVRAICDNEDLNRNGVLEVAAEDANGSGSLEPRKSDVAISVEGSNRTNASGAVQLKIEYPQNVGSWIVYKILVAASGVSGTEGRATFTGVVKVPVDVVKNKDVPPPFLVSPYGPSSSATVPAVGPQGATVHLCTNPN